MRLILLPHFAISLIITPLDDYAYGALRHYATFMLRCQRDAADIMSHFILLPPRHHVLRCRRRDMRLLCRVYLLLYVMMRYAYAI